MTLALAMILVGGILVYAAVKGLSPVALLLGNNQTPSTNKGLPK